MCNDPVTFKPFNGFLAEYFFRIAISPGISFSAMSISFLPQSAKPMSFILYSGIIIKIIINKIRVYHQIISNAK